MAKVEVLGPRRLLDPTLRLLQREGVLQLREPPPGLASPAAPAHRVAMPDERAAAATLHETLARIDRLAARLPRPAGAEPLPLPDGEGAGLDAALDAAEARLHDLEGRRTALLAERDATSRLARLLGALAPLYAEVRAPPRTRAFGLALRRDRIDVLPLLEAELSRATGGAAVVRARSAGDDVAVLVMTPASRAASVAALLFERGVEEVKLPKPYEAFSPARALVALGDRLRALPQEIAAAEAERGAYAARLAAALELARHSTGSRLGRLEAEAQCGETAHAFVVWGWVPRAGLPLLREVVSREMEGRVEVVEAAIARGEDADPPVVLLNPPWLRPFQLLLALVPLPRYGSVDPTPWLAAFYPLFVGLVLGDVAFGILAVAIALVVRWRRWGGELGRDVAAVALACGVAAAVFGVLYGEAFGSFGERLGLHPILLHRREAMHAFAALSLATGVVHLLFGLALGTRDALRRRAFREGIGRLARMLLLLAGVAAALATARLLPASTLMPAGAVALGALLVDVACHGPLALLEAVLAVGNVLSYARLLALGLASVMLAEVANGMVDALPGVAGVFLGVFLHAVNFSVGVVSPVIAALRLQYVEFFDKFYREGGRPYRPFALA